MDKRVYQPLLAFQPRLVVEVGVDSTALVGAAYRLSVVGADTFVVGVELVVVGVGSFGVEVG